MNIIQIKNLLGWIGFTGPFFLFSFRESSPSEMQTPCEPSNCQTTTTWILKRFVTYSIYHWTDHTCTILTNSSQNIFQPKTKAFLLATYITIFIKIITNHNTLIKLLITLKSTDFLHPPTHPNPLIQSSWSMNQNAYHWSFTSQWASRKTRTWPVAASAPAIRPRIKPSLFFARTSFTILSGHTSAIYFSKSSASSAKSNNKHKIQQEAKTAFLFYIFVGNFFVRDSIN